MKKEIKEFVENRNLVTKRVQKWIGLYTKKEICDIINISRPTLDYRLENNNWKKKEINVILEKMPY